MGKKETFQVIMSKYVQYVLNWDSRREGEGGREGGRKRGREGERGRERRKGGKESVCEKEESRKTKQSLPASVRSIVTNINIH